MAAKIRAYILTNRDANNVYKDFIEIWLTIYVTLKTVNFNSQYQGIVSDVKLILGLTYLTKGFVFPISAKDIHLWTQHASYHSKIIMVGIQLLILAGWQLMTAVSMKMMENVLTVRILGILHLKLYITCAIPTTVLL